ncbi:hypothetical protein Tcan_14070 [Toxocara canis]|uniref:Uncharacterized protein n=1 Tax=Toxocara canis TaxID=6265 RepID=A0A0B2VCI6_TOXCA|nr:hypothetical protein Tcan_14070 [Toxocara canis]
MAGLSHRIVFPTRILPLIFVIALATVLLLQSDRMQAHWSSKTEDTSQKSVALVRSAKGPVEYSEVEEIVYKNYGYWIERIEKPFIKLQSHLDCPVVFEQWLTIANTYDPNQQPPKEIAPALLSAFTMNNLSRLEYWLIVIISLHTENTLND